jgi:hypothetical protein
MAKQDGFVKLKGTIDDVSFYRTKDGYMARKKVTIDPKRLAKDPAFERTREAMANFKKATEAGKLLRKALRQLIKNASDKRAANRLSAKMVSVIKADTTNKRGQKNVIDGETELLAGFDFNTAAPLSNAFGVQYEASIDRVSGAAQIKLPAFNKDMVTAPFEATHFQLRIAGVEVDFEKGAYVVEFKESASLSLNEREFSAFSLAVNLPANSKHPLFLVLGITFFVDDLGELFPLKNGAFNSLSIVQVSGV